MLVRWFAVGFVGVVVVSLLLWDAVHSRPRRHLPPPRAADAFVPPRMESPRVSSKASPHPPRLVMAFYYAWYANVSVDGDWFHWDQPVLRPDNTVDPTAAPIVPPKDAGVTYWPALGLYSSNDPRLVAAHFVAMRRAGIDVAIVSWYPDGTADQKDDRFRGFQNRNIGLILDEARKVGLSVAFHIEPYAGRTPATVVRDMTYLHDTYGAHPATLFWPGSRGARMLVFVYDSYLSPASEWSSALPGPSYAVGLCVERTHVRDLIDGRFDGAYTYFAANGFVWGSTTRNWQTIRNELGSLLFVPCVGPGYNDQHIRPWNGRNTHARQEGRYYRDMWRHVTDLGLAGASADAVAITSWNEWHEGTQIEPAVDRPGYLAVDSVDYLALTAELAAEYKRL